jgi:hypothetical protein
VAGGLGAREEKEQDMSLDESHDEFDVYCVIPPSYIVYCFPPSFLLVFVTLPSVNKTSPSPHFRFITDRVSD